MSPERLLSDKVLDKVTDKVVDEVMGISVHAPVFAGTNSIRRLTTSHEQLTVLLERM